MKALLEGDILKQAIESAYRLLTIRSRSENELRERLKLKRFKEDIINQTIVFLKEKGYLDDKEFSFNFGRYLLHKRSFGPLRIAQELRKRGISKGLCQETLKKLSKEIDEKELIQRVLKTGEMRSILTSRVEGERKVIQRLLRRGFHIDTIFEVLKELRLELERDDRE